MAGGDESAVGEANSAELLALGTMLFLLVFHNLLDMLERAVRKHRYMNQILQKLFRELMSLGIVAFILFVLEITNAEFQNQKHTFEIVHMTIFFVVIGYSLLTFSLMLLSIHISKEWNELENMSMQQMVDSNAKYEVMTKHRQDNGLLWYYCNIPFVREYHRVTKQVLFQHIRLHFLHSNHLSPDFSFSRYLRKCKQHVFLQLAQVSNRVWIAVLTLIAFDLIQRNALSRRESVSDLYLQVVFACIALFLVATPALILLKTKRILTTINESKLIDFDPIAARFVWAHWEKEELDSENDSDVSVDLEFSDEEHTTIVPRHKRLHLKREAAVQNVARLYRLQTWGVGPSKENLRASMKLRSQGPTLRDIETEHVPSEKQEKPYMTEVNQLDLFWFGRHTFIISLIQIVLFVFVVYLALLVQLSKVLFVANNPLSILVSIWFMVPIPVVVYCIPASIPLYTIIIHVGQLVDMDVVLEAVKKGEHVRRNGPENLEADSDDLVASSPNLLSLRRERTLDSLPPHDRRMYKLTLWIYSQTMKSIVLWLVVADIMIIALLTIDQVWDSVEIRNVLLALELLIAIIFVAEVGVKVYSGFWTVWLLADCIVVLFMLSSAILQIIQPTFVYGGFVSLLRLFIAEMSNQVGRVIIEDVEKELDVIHHEKVMQSE